MGSCERNEGMVTRDGLDTRWFGICAFIVFFSACYFSV